MSDFQERVASLSPKRLMLLALDLQSRIDELEKQQSEPIAVIGIGCRIPGAEDGPDGFWRLLEQGKDAIGDVPPDRWDADAYYDANIDSPGRMYTKRGGFLSQIDQFDAPFFGIAGREAVGMDPQQRMLLEVCWEAVEHAGHSPRKLAGTATGVFVGICSGDYQTMLLAMGDEAIDGYLASGTSASIAAGRISYTLGLQGPSMAIDTACSASLVAIHLACRSLRARECEMVLAGGVNAILSPATTIALSKAHMMAPDGTCKTFDSRADGFVRAEGCGIVMLKRLSDAVSNRDHILAVIRGSAVNQDGRSSGMTAPNGTAQEDVIRSALLASGVQPHEIGYVEAHGTGTSLGDPIEAHALAAVLGPGRSADDPLVVGSVKTNLGHMESTAGVVGLIKTVLALEHEQIPAHLHFRELNPHIDWGTVPVEIPLAKRPWPRGKKRRLAGVSSFGFSGTNAHVIVEEAPAAGNLQRVFERPQHLLTVSARNEKALRQLVATYGEELGRRDVGLADFCYTANAGRAHFEHRLAVIGGTREQIQDRLRSTVPGPPVGARSKLRVGFLFPGQGSQYAGMGKELYEAQPVFRAALDECAEHLGAQLDRPLLDLLWGNASHLLDETVYTQPALFAVEYSLAQLWRNWGIEPASVTGHSVGEYVAACLAGVYSLADGLKLIAGRGRLMQGVSGSGAMTAIWADEGRVRTALQGLEENVTIAALNGPESVVISGYVEQLGKAEQRLSEMGIKTQRLRTSHGFHSPQMREMEEAFDQLASEVRFAQPRLPLVSSVTGRLVGPDEMSHASYWRLQVSEPVRFQQAMGSLGKNGSEVFLELGPGTTLCGLGRQCLSEPGLVWLPSLRKARGECEQMLEGLSQLYTHGAEVDWEAFDQPYTRRRVPLPTYPFQRQRYWADFGSVRRVPSSRPHDAPESSSQFAHSAVQQEPPADWFYEVSWQRQAAPRNRALDSGTARIQKDGGAPLRCLIVSANNDLAAELASRIRELGGNATLAASGEAARAELLRQTHNLVLHLASSAAVGSFASGHLEDHPSPSENACVCEVLETAQAVLSHESGVRLWIVTTGAQFAAAAQSLLDLEQAPLWGFGKTFALEHPSCWGGLIDLDPSVSASQSAAELLSAIGNDGGEDQIAFRSGDRYAARLARSQVPSLASAAFTGNKSYIITGGLGELGLKTASWMAEHGARNLVLIGRRAPSPQATAVIEGLRREGARIEVFAADVGSLSQMTELFDTVQSALPPVGGVLHAAGVLDDGIVAQQTPERFHKVMHAKVAGAWNLHQLTMQMPLDFFVLFSSVASLIGSAGQASYAAANAYLDALAKNRRAAGLPALSINWGGWAEVGMAARAAARTPHQTEYQLMAPDLALAALKKALLMRTAQVGIAAIDWAAHSSLHGRQPFFKDVLPKTVQDGSASSAHRTSSERLLDVLRGSGSQERKSLLTRYLVEILAPTLGIEPRTIQPSEPITDYGLDSLMALEFRNRINSEFQIQIPAVQFLRGMTLEEVVTRIEAELPEPASQEPGTAVSCEDAEFPLSLGQQQWWFGHKFMPGWAQNNIGLTARALPRLDFQAFEKAMAKLMLRHAALRTIFFESESGIPMQRVLPGPFRVVVLIDASSLSDEQIKKEIHKDFGQPLALDQPMFRVVVFRRPEEDVLFFKLDHIILDHWSVRLCIEDLREFYISELTGTNPALEPLRAEYREFVEWETNFMESPESAKVLEYWKQKLGGQLPVLKLPSSGERPQILVSRGRALPLTFSKDHWTSIQRISRENRATGYSVLLAAFQVLLYRYTGQTDIVTGTSVAGREDSRWASVVGLFINVLGLRCNLSGNPTFSEYLVQVRDTVWEALEHQNFPLSLLLMKIRQPRTLERIPVFQSFFNFLNDRSGDLRTLFMGMQDREIDFGFSKLHPFMVVAQQEGRLEISLQLGEMDGTLIGYLNYNSDVLDHSIAETMVADYCRLLDAILRDPQIHIDELLPGVSSDVSQRENILL
jgi:acyl transferase domain-containing protein/acyl carrier protein